MTASLPHALLYPDYQAESYETDFAQNGLVHIVYRRTCTTMSDEPVSFEDSFWFARANLRWFAKALHACATYDRANATEYFPEAVLAHASDSISIADNGADYGVRVRVSNQRDCGAPHGSARGGYSFFISLPLAELLANELLALSAGDHESGA